MSKKSNSIDLMIVDDDDGHRTLIVKNLRRIGILNEIVSLSSGQEALDYVFCRNAHANRKQNGLLMLLDLNMPGIDGFEVLSQMKADEDAKKIPVVILTTTDGREEMERCYALGCSIYITKPVDHFDFVEAVNRLGLFISIMSVPEGKSCKR